MSNEIHKPLRPVGVIGGTGFYHMSLEDEEALKVATPFGDARVMRGRLGDRQVVFVARHGGHHEFLPHEVNYRANVYALKKLGARQVFALSTAGALKKTYAIGDFVVLKQFVDLTHGRRNTFFGAGNTAYVSMAEPFCPILSDTAARVLSEIGFSMHIDGVYVCVNGPHFSTRAESRLYAGFGNVVGMTIATEAKLAREAGLCYSAIACVVDYDTCSMGMEDMKGLWRSIHKAASCLARQVPDSRDCRCHSALQGSVVSVSDAPDNILDLILPDADSMMRACRPFR